MKVLMDARSLGRNPSGVGMYVYNIACELNKDKNFHTELVTDVCESREMKELKETGIPVHMYGKDVSKKLSLFFYYRFLQQCIYKTKPDIFWEVNNLVPIRIRNPFGKLVVTIHDIFPVTNPEHFGKRYPVYFKYGVRKTIESFDALIYDSEETKKETELFFPKAKGKKTLMGYVIVETMLDIPVTDNSSFLFVGNMETRKGSDILLRAYRKYRKNGGKLNLRTAGKIRDDTVRKLEEECEKFVQGFQYLGYISREEKAKEYASCFCFVFPSRLEGFGIPIIEAMQYGKKIIASDLPVFHEIAGDSISYVSMSGSTEDRAEQLAVAMKKAEEDMTVAPGKSYPEIIQRFNADSIGSSIRRFLKECTGEDRV
jgi:glycosyltransferase involved in cell wall biosynthesis